MAIRRFIATRGDLVLAVALAALYMVEIFIESAFGGDRAISIPAALVFCGSLAWRRRQPLVPLALGLVVIELSNLAAPPLAEAGAFLLGVMVAIYSAGAHTEGRATIVGGVIVAAMIPFAAIEPGQTFTLADFLFFVVFFGGPFFGGRVIRRRRFRERTLEGRAVELEREGEERARAAVAAERTRIARELHDVIAHSVSVMLLQARGARRVLTANGEPASEPLQPVQKALETIDRSGQQALEEMRRLLSVLRLGQEGEELSLAPQPSLRRVGELADSVRAAGLPVELSVEGDVADLPPGVDVSAYRIVQEGLTNTLKHAGSAHARVVIRRSETELEIEVSDDGKGAVNTQGAGHGLVGMRERVGVYGGHLEAAPRPDGGYAVSAHLPLGPAS